MTEDANDAAAPRPTKISVQGLYKIFGPDPTAMLEHVLAGMSKADLLNEHNHVLA